MSRSSQVINAIGTTAGNVFNFMKEPWRAGIDYATKDGNKTWKGLAKEMFGGNKKDLTAFTAGDQTYNGAKIATALGGLGIGYRFASGGGAYRDKNGNTDIAGIPFI
jgi:hypothetical protein